ncbi:hypothetical protein Goshw_027059 [Gossypium schwendimanii]|uniref:Uncharacterized protein n=2 Tax=Gossypium TaxID=3633 RepID=A0A7J9MY28_GOSSC|nr:hypothetical protein [Gossypium schwendimanii]
MYHKKKNGSYKTVGEPGSDEFISALAAGTKSKLVVEITSGASPSTIALATATKHTATGSRFVSILPKAALAEAEREAKASGLIDIIEFETGDPINVWEVYVIGMKDKILVRSIKQYHIGKGMEIATISERRDHGSGGSDGRTCAMKKSGIGKSKWIVEVDEASGEEHIFKLQR